jgi:hypothetical protein
MIRCEWSNFDDRLDDPTIPEERCIETAEWNSCQPFTGARTCPRHKCRCATPLSKAHDCSPSDLAPYRAHQDAVERFQAHAPARSPVPSPGPIRGATGPTGPGYPYPLVLATGMAMPSMAMPAVPKARGPETPRDPNVITEMLNELDEMTDDIDFDEDDGEEDILDEDDDGEKKSEDVAERSRRWMSLDLPDGWTYWGCLPILSADLLFEELDRTGFTELDQDIFTISTPEKPPRFQIDVGWYPDYDKKGKYRCVVVTTDGLPADEDGNPWNQDPIMQLETRDTFAVWAWLSDATSKIYRQHYRNDHRRQGRGK